MTHVSEHGVPLLPQKAVGLLHDTELVVRTFQRAHRWRTAGQVRGNSSSPRSCGSQPTLSPLGCG